MHAVLSRKNGIHVYAIRYKPCYLGIGIYEFMLAGGKKQILWLKHVIETFILSNKAINEINCEQIKLYSFSNFCSVSSGISFFFSLFLLSGRNEEKITTSTPNDI